MRSSQTHVAEGKPKLRKRDIALRALLAVLTLAVFTGVITTINLARDITQKTDGYLTIRWSGIYTRHSTFVRDDHKTVHLLGMAHVAGKGFYARVISKIPVEGSLVLTEGVSDRSKLLTDGLRYEGLARRLGWESQKDNFELQLALSHKTLNADIDIKDLSPEGIANVKALGRIMKGDWDEKNFKTLEDNNFKQTFEREFLSLRTNRLIQVFDQEIDLYPTIAIPWGAMHLRDVELLLEARGFHLKSEEDLELLTF